MKYISLNKGIKALVLLVVMCALPACEEYLEIPDPTNAVTGESAFLNKGTIDKLMNNMYNKWAGTGGQALQYSRSVEFFSDNAYNPTTSTYPEQTGELTPETYNMSAGLWLTWYQAIYAANMMIEGLPTAEGIDEATKDLYMGAALTVRAGSHYFLARTFGDVPLNLATNVTENALKPRMPVSDVYTQIISDLNDAIDLLPPSGANDKRFIDNKNVPQALLARVYTTIGNWAAAETAASAVIASGGYQLVGTLSDVFYRPSPEVINSLGNVINFGTSYQNSCYYGRVIVPYNAFGENSYPALSVDLLNSFEPGDNRKSAWVALKNSSNYPNPDNRNFCIKYYNATVTPIIPGKEQDFAFIRLAEMYLIRAEARARKTSPDLPGAAADLNMIRNRAGLANTTAATQADLVNAIMRERRIEFMFEGGFRWDDLVRTGTADAIISALPWKINWDSYKTLWPVPLNQIKLNKSLVQNPGYDAN